MDWCLSAIALSALSYTCGNVLTCLCIKVNYMVKTEENLEELKREWNHLLAKRDYVLRRVTAEELKGRQQQPAVGKWLLEVQAIETGTRELIDEASSLDASAENQRPSTSGCWSSDNISNCFLGEKVFKQLNEVISLSGQEFQDVTEQAPPPDVEVRSIQQITGLDSTLEKAWERLMDDGIRILGIYGMGGVGKTTLLKLINNKLDELEFKKDVDVVIWVEVSQNANIGKIQDDIGKRIGLYDVNWCRKPQREKASDIHRVLKDKKPRFVLLLDDLWEQVSLEDIGIPSLQGSKCKVVFTTRSKDVCGRMGADVDIEVECLGENDAWDLFKLKARCSRLSYEVLDIAKKIAAKCHGLPLALVVIGNAMASKTTLQEWRRALSILEYSPSEVNGAEDIFEVLKLSFDHLRSKDEKQCFQYCALFPKGYDIKQDELVEYWIGEGFIDGKEGRQKAMNRGYDIIDTLVEASLLFKDGESKHKVYMHDMIREMALWIVSEFEKGEGFVVKTGGLSKLPKVKNWRTVTKMSLMNNEIGSIPGSPLLPNPNRLVSLFLQNNKLVKIDGTFFVAMSSLEVLNLSRNHGLIELPEEISALTALRYLNLSETGINNLPKNLKGLRKLIHLDLESTPNLGSISLLVPELRQLQVLKFYGSKASLDLFLLKQLKFLEDLVLGKQDN